MSWPRGYKTCGQPQTQNKAQGLAACGHVFASSQSLRFLESENELKFYNLEARVQITLTVSWNLESDQLKINKIDYYAILLLPLFRTET